LLFLHTTKSSISGILIPLIEKVTYFLEFDAIRNLTKCIYYLYIRKKALKVTDRK